MASTSPNALGTMFQNSRAADETLLESAGSPSNRLAAIGWWEKFTNIVRGTWFDVVVVCLDSRSAAPLCAVTPRFRSVGIKFPLVVDQN